MSILVELRLCCFPTNKGCNSGQIRTTQYINGLNKFFEYLPILHNYNVDIFITDNTIPDGTTLPEEILNIM